MRTAPAPDRPEVRRRSRRALTHLLAVVLGALLAVAVVATLGLGDAQEGVRDAVAVGALPSRRRPANPALRALALALSLALALAHGHGAPHRTVREAEDGDLAGPLRRATADEAVGGAFVGVEDGQGDGEGSVTFTLEVPVAGSYVVWARVLAPDDSSNSFFVQVDDAEDLTWHAPGPARSETAEEWTWAAVREEDAATPQLFLLEAGRHELRFAAREDGTGLDRVVVTNDLVEVPAGAAGG